MTHILQCLPLGFVNINVSISYNDISLSKKKKNVEKLYILLL
jgi:hypothetical protein